MPMLTDLADACRKSGLRIVEVEGWRSRGHGSMSSVEAVVCHHTATSKAAAGDYPSLRIVRDGRTGLPGPLAQLGLGRDGTVYVIAAGVAYHAGETFHDWQDNWHAIGIEAEHDGLSGWDDGQYAAYVALVAALVEHYDLRPAAVQGHKEVAAPKGRKIDPTFDMDRFRHAVANHQEDDMFSDEDREVLHRIERMTRTKLERVNKRLARANDLLRKVKGNDAQVAEALEEIQAALAEAGEDEAPRA